MNADWSPDEVKLIVDDYFRMLTSELKNLSYSKTEHRNRLLTLLKNRNGSSLEYKHRNITAALNNMGLPGIKGYKPAINYQKQLLESEIINYITEHKAEVEALFDNFSKSIESRPQIEIFENIDRHLVDPPEPTEISEREPSFLPIKTNYLKKEQNNRAIGEKGEEFVFRFEKARLIRAGKELLSEKVEWVSRDNGDGTGYDILSKNENGSDRFIEVKTTKLSKYTPIFFSKNELAFSKKTDRSFFLYRVFNFSKFPQLFIRQGQYESYCRVFPETFKGVF
ncbi:MAG: DUF3883 domain-containing protein [Chitinophagaceae bacterium]|nr:DUF3883 domain-containing protein [Chitinophagaceae bacterium]